MKTQISHSNINQILSKKLGLRILGIALLFLFSFNTYASQTPTCSIKKQNGSSCYWTTLQSVTHNPSGTYTITVLVEVDGSSGGNGGNGCQGLSHYAVQVVTGTYSNVSWQKLTGDVTFNGIGVPVGGGNSQSFNTGFKLDNANNFGDNHAGSFTVTYTLTNLQDQKFAAKAGSNSNDALFTVADFNQVLNCPLQTGPVANPDAVTTPINTHIDITVLENDTRGSSDIDATSVTFIGTVPPTSTGVFTVDHTTGLVTFTPGTDYTGIATIGYRIADANGLTSTSTITVTIVNAHLTITKIPTLFNDNGTQKISYLITVNNDGAADAQSVTITDNLPNTLTFFSQTHSAGTWTSPNLVIPTLVKHTSATLTIVATVNPGFTGTQSITNTAYVHSQTTAEISANAVTSVSAFTGPVANPDAVTTPINTHIDITVLENDTRGSSDIDPTSVTFIGTVPPTSTGVFTVDHTTGLVTFTPSTDYTGIATIGYRIADANGLTSTSTITVTITPSTITNNFPGTGFSTVAFEDLWPFKGDYDLNDLVMDYKFEITSNSSNYVSKVVGTFKIKAFGASFENGFGFQFPNVPNESITSVTGYDLKEGFIILNSNGTESEQNKPTIIVYDNAFKEMTSPGGIGVNTDPTQPYVTPKTLTITINFAPNTCLYNALDIANFNPFIFVNKVREVEVHLPDYAPTSRANPSLFGTGDDNSIPAQGKYYKTANNLPWAINTYEQFDYPKEKVDISQAFLNFAAWATSGGISFKDWYKDLTENRNAGLIYPIHH